MEAGNSQLISIAIWGVAVFSILGIIFGVALAATARQFHVGVDPKIDQVRDNLPSANCGACGYAGCQGYAEAVVESPEVVPNLCTPGGKSVAESVAAITNKLAGEVKEEVAMIRCHGTTSLAFDQAKYEGIQTCTAAALAFGGPKSCKNGCLGLGDCERVCPFDAIHIKDLGIAEVTFDKCTGCGLCVSACPKQIINLYPRTHRIELSCVAKDKASVVRPTCLVGCTTCRKCISACPAGALAWDGKTVLIDHPKCLAYGSACEEACVEICPTHVMHRRNQLPRPEVTAPVTASTSV